MTEQQPNLYQAFSLKLMFLAKLQTDPAQARLLLDMASIYDQSHEHDRDVITESIVRTVLYIEERTDAVRETARESDEKIIARVEQLEAHAQDTQLRLTALERQMLNEVTAQLRDVEQGLARLINDYGNEREHAS